MKREPVTTYPTIAPAAQRWIVAMMRAELPRAAERLAARRAREHAPAA